MNKNDKLLKTQLIKYQPSFPDSTLAVGGSSLIGEYHDIDLIFIGEKVPFGKLTALRETLMEELGCRVSICPMTRIMFRNKHLWQGKIATMIYKGVDWIWGDDRAEITFEELRRISVREAPTELAHYLKNIIEKPEKKEKMVELIIQLATLIMEVRDESVRTGEANIFLGERGVGEASD